MQETTSIVIPSSILYLTNEIKQARARHTMGPLDYPRRYDDEKTVAIYSHFSAQAELQKHVM
jgi:hypothetical protein